MSQGYRAVCPLQRYEDERGSAGQVAACWVANASRVVYGYDRQRTREVHAAQRFWDDSKRKEGTRPSLILEILHHPFLIPSLFCTSSGGMTVQSSFINDKLIKIGRRGRSAFRYKLRDQNRLEKSWNYIIEREQTLHKLTVLQSAPKTTIFPLPTKDQLVQPFVQHPPSPSPL